MTVLRSIFGFAIFAGLFLILDGFEGVGMREQQLQLLLEMVQLALILGIDVVLDCYL